MCGLVGVFGNTLGEKENVMFNTLLDLDVTRGVHSTGVALGIVNKNKEDKFIIAKRMGRPALLRTKYPYLFNAAGFLTEEVQQKAFALIGHNRHATKGAVNDLNAHPFHCGRFIGAHNGTIREGEDTFLNNYETDGETDSEKLYAALDAKDGDIEEVFKEIKGAAALSFFDFISGRLFLYRNKDRPLFYLENVSSHNVIYASERWMLEGAVKRAKAETAYPVSKITELPVNTLLSFDRANGFSLSTNRETVVLESGSRSVVTYYGAHYHQQARNNNSRGASYSTQYTPPVKRVPFAGGGVDLDDEIPFGQKATPSQKGAETPNLLVKNDLSGKDYNFSEPALQKLLSEGCQYCSGNLTRDLFDKGEYLLFDRETVLCEVCKDDWS